MAIINKIRERSGLAVAVIAVALLLFIVGGDYFSNRNGGGLFGSSKNKVGEINGTDIDYQQFTKLFEQQKLQFESSAQRSASEQEINQIKDQVWDKLIFENVDVKEFEKLGIVVTDDELRELVQGNKNMHPYVKQQFSDQKGNFSRPQFDQFIKAYADNTLPQPQRTAWDNFKRELIQIRMREKFSNLLNKSTFLTDSETKNAFVAENEKASGKFLYVPFKSISDSTIKVSDSEISDYYSKHTSEFDPYDSRAVTYVAFKLVPTKEDSANMKREIDALAKGLASAPDAQKYASQNSDIRTPYLKSPNQLSADVRAALSTAIVGSLIGPFKVDNSYTIYKYEGTANDSLYSMRASHILFRADSTMTDSLRADARKKAEEVLAQLKGGADFASLARQYGTDGTAQQGGDLGVFQNNGGMVKSFEKALFGYSGAGLMPGLVVTDFGYHIVKVTEPKSNVKYKLAAVSKELQVGDATSNTVFQKADNLRTNAKNLKGLEDAVKKDHSLVLVNADNLAPNSTNVNSIPNAREVVSWAYGADTEIGEVADRVFVLGDTYVVAGLKSASDRAKPKAADFKDAISTEIRNTKKGESIVTKLGKPQGDLAAVATKYGLGAVVEEVKDVNYANGTLNSAGFDAIGLGRLFGQKMGTRSKPFAGQSGVFVMETLQKIAAPAIADYKPFKQLLAQKMGLARMGAYLGEQILRDNAHIIDNRAKLF